MQSKLSLSRFWRIGQGAFTRQALKGLLSLGAAMVLGISSTSAQDLTFYNGLDCKLSVKVTYSNTSCPGAAPLNISACVNLNSPGTTTVTMPSGWTNVVKIEYFCGWNCPTLMTAYDCLTGQYYPSYITCCGKQLTIQGALDPGEFRIDAQ